MIVITKKVKGSAKDVLGFRSVLKLLFFKKRLLKISLTLLLKKFADRQSMEFIVLLGTK
jgi:hypothetical protein